MSRLGRGLLVVLLAGCAGEKSESSASLSGRYPLQDGFSIVIDDDGALVLEGDGRRLWASPAGGPVVGRTVEEGVEATLGMWNFTRVAQTDDAFDTLVGVETDGSEILLTYTSAAGNQGLLVVAQDGDAVRFVWTSDGLYDAHSLGTVCDADGTFFGWGEQYANVNRKNEAFPLFVSEQGIGRDGGSWSFSGDENTTYFPMPWYIDARGFGVLVDTDARTNADLCAADADVATLEVMDGGALVWTVFVGPTPLDVVRQLGDDVGRPAQPPEWAFNGAWMCAQGGREVVTALVDRVEAGGILASTLWVQDWTGRRENPGGGYGVQYRWTADEEELYPDIAGFFGELHGRGYKVVGYVNPFVDPILNHWAEMEAGGMLPLHPETGEVYTFIGPRGNMTTADLTAPATRTYIKEHLRAAVVDVGLDGWMADFAEWLPIDAVLADGSDAALTHNRYPELWQSLTREVMDEERPDGDWLMFARSGWTGVQSVAMVHWNGDQEADWLPEDGLPTVVPAMISLGLSGQPYVTSDIAGFSGGPSTAELYWRWTELGALSPFMRTHDGNERDRNWRWDSDAETTAHFAAMSRLHAALAPELVSWAADAQVTGAPLVRHLMLDSPTDETVWDINDQYLLGPDLLVAPVLTEGATSRRLYLPVGTWVHVWSGTSYAGPAWVEVDAPIGEPPLFSRDVDRPDLRAAVAVD